MEPAAPPLPDELFRAAAASMLDPISIMRAVRDEAGQIVDFEYVYVNEAAAGFVGHHDFVGHGLLELFPFHRESGLFDAYCALLATGQPIVWEAWPVRLPGEAEPRAFDTRAVRLGDGFAATWRDVTERERTRACLQAQADELSRSNAALQQFVYVASHDLAEPLRTIVGFADLLRDRCAGQLDPTSSEFLEHIVQGTARMQAMLDDLLVYSRVGSQPGQRIAVDLDVLAAGVVGALQARIKEADGSVAVAPLPEVFGNPVQLGRLLQNLITNALTYVAPGTAPRVRVSAERDGDQWRVCVADNGVGIAEKDRERAFKLFTRLQVRDAASGTGLGLAICARIVERHGGRIWVEDAPGGGCCFYFTLPASADGGT